MNKAIGILLCLAALNVAAQAGLSVRGLSCEHVAQPLGIETVQPRFSWKLDAEENGETQTAYRILAAATPERLAAGKGTLWDSGWMESASNQLIPYAGAPLESLQNGWWKVCVKDGSGKKSNWSEAARFATGLLPGDNPTGQWIFNPSSDWRTGTSWFRKTIQLEKAPEQALVLLASRGYHEFYVNGKKVDDRALAPNASIMEKRTLYVVYDIAPLLEAGKNTLAVWISPGRIAASKVEPTFLLEAKLGNQTFVSDASWKTKTSNLKRYYAKIPQPGHGGEQWNESAYVPGWNKNGLEDSTWDSAVVRNESTALSADIMPPTRRVQTISAKKIERRSDGTVLVDFGGYFTGQLDAHVKGEPGKPVRFITLGDLERPTDFGQFSEAMPGPDGTANFQHHFNWMCGRWVVVEGLTALPELSDFIVHRISTDFGRIGFFQCSDNLLNQLYETDLYTYANLTLDGYNHDCTHRERRGYGEHAFGTSRGMEGSYNLTAFLQKWLRDWRDVQEAGGYMPHTAPEGRGGGGTLWSSFTVLGPWDAYLQSGDRSFLEKNYDSARRWMDYLDAATPNGTLVQYENKTRWYFLGDWARPSPLEIRKPEAHVASFSGDPLGLAFNNGIYALDLQTMGPFSDALGDPDRSRLWKKRLEALQLSAHKKFYLPESGDYVEQNQVLSMLMQLTGIAPPQDRVNVQAALDAALKERNYIDAGSSGLTVFLEFINQHPEYHAWFFDVLHRRDYPSYAYFLDQGYDTWPELWEPTCSSKVHSCYVGVSSFFTRVLAGLQPLADAPGYERFRVAPSFMNGLDWVSYDFDSPQGWIKINWEREGEEIVLDLLVPPGATADVELPSGVENVESGKHQFRFSLENF